MKTSIATTYSLNKKGIQAVNLGKIQRRHDGIGVSANKSQILPEIYPGLTQGAQGTPFKRLQTGFYGVSYQDGLDKPINSRSNPRKLSNIIGQQTSKPIKNSRLGLSLLVTFWGQFLDHDLTLGLPPVDLQNRENLNIKIQNGDNYFPNGSQIPFQRTNSISSNKHSKTPRQQINTHTSFVDLTQVYGANQTFARQIRSMIGGKLLSSNRPQDKNLLPRWSQFGVNGQAGNRFRGGQQRTNQNLALTNLQTLFFREHNRLCDYMLQLDKSLDPNNPQDDQLIYNFARNYNIALFQKITYKDWLPNLLGKKKWNQFIGKYTGPKQSANPTLLNEFSNAAFRIGHILLANYFPQIDENGNIVQTFHQNKSFKDITI